MKTQANKDKQRKMNKSELSPHTKKSSATERSGFKASNDSEREAADEESENFSADFGSKKSASHETGTQFGKMAREDRNKPRETHKTSPGFQHKSHRGNAKKQFNEKSKSAK